MKLPGHGHGLNRRYTDQRLRTSLFPPMCHPIAPSHRRRSGMATPRGGHSVTAVLAVEEFLDTLPIPLRDENAFQLNAFLAAYGRDHPLNDLKPEQVSAFARQLGSDAVNLDKRLAILRA